METRSLRSVPAHGAFPSTRLSEVEVGCRGPGGCDSSPHCLPSGMDELMEVSFSPLAATGKPLSRCGKCHRFMKYIQVSGGEGAPTAPSGPWPPYSQTRVSLATSRGLYFTFGHAGVFVLAVIQARVAYDSLAHKHPQCTPDPRNM